MSERVMVIRRYTNQGVQPGGAGTVIATRPGLFGSQQLVQLDRGPRVLVPANQTVAL